MLLHMKQMENSTKRADSNTKYVCRFSTGKSDSGSDALVGSSYSVDCVVSASVPPSSLISSSTSLISEEIVGLDVPVLYAFVGVEVMGA